MVKRNRKGETIPLEYLKMCHKYHDTWLMGNSGIIDGNIELPEESNIDLIEKTIRFIHTNK